MFEQAPALISSVLEFIKRHRPQLLSRLGWRELFSHLAVPLVVIGLAYGDVQELRLAVSPENAVYRIEFESKVTPGEHGIAVPLPLSAVLVEPVPVDFSLRWVASGEPEAMISLLPGEFEDNTDRLLLERRSLKVLSPLRRAKRPLVVLLNGTAETTMAVDGHELPIHELDKSYWASLPLVLNCLLVGVFGLGATFMSSLRANHQPEHQGSRDCRAGEHEDNVVDGNGQDPDPRAGVAPSSECDGPEVPRNT